MKIAMTIIPRKVRAIAMYRVTSDCRKATIGLSSPALRCRQLTCDYYPYLPLSNKYINLQGVPILIGLFLPISSMYKI